MPDSIPLKGRGVSSDGAFEKVIAAQAKAHRLAEEVKALRKDRKGLLQEFNAITTARPVPHSPLIARRKAKAETVRVCCGDVHGMRMDRDCIAAFLRDLKMLDPDGIVLGGDILECGGHLARHQPIGYIALCDYTYVEDLNAANWFLDEVQTAAPHAVIHAIQGNHEQRVERWCVDECMGNGREAAFLESVYGPETRLRFKERGIQWYKKSEIYHEGLPRGWIKLGSMYFTHELGTSANAARQAVMKTGGNVTFFHTHREDSATVVLPATGLVKAFNPGCLSQMQPIWKHSDPTTWSQGYGIDFILKSGAFQRVHAPIWRGESVTSAMIERFKS